MEAGGIQVELQDFAQAARAAARAASAKGGSSRCSACKARGVTLWKVTGRLRCASCRTANEIAHSGQPGHRQEPDGRKATRKEGTVTVATAGKGIAWALRQGRQDRKARTQCESYKSFLEHYPKARPLGEATPESVPWTVLPDVPPTKGEYALLLTCIAEPSKSTLYVKDHICGSSHPF